MVCFQLEQRRRLSRVLESGELKSEEVSRRTLLVLGAALRSVVIRGGVGGASVAGGGSPIRQASDRARNRLQQILGGRAANNHQYLKIT